MPNLDWNKRWGNQAEAFSDGDEYFNRNKIYGYQWGDPLKTTAKFVVPEYILEYLTDESVVLEIGPGGGRYSQFLVNSKKLYMVEYNPQFFPILEKLLEGSPSERVYVQSPGSSLPGIPDRSIDFLFSFDCFVHLDIDLINGYLEEISRVLKLDGIAVIHYADKRKELAQKKGTDFANTTPEIMEEILKAQGFQIKKHDTERISHSAIVAFSLKKP